MTGAGRMVSGLTLDQDSVHVKLSTSVIPCTATCRTECRRGAAAAGAERERERERERGGLVLAAAGGEHGNTG